MIKFGLRELLFLAILIAMPAASWWLVFKPQNEEIDQARKEIEHKESMLTQLDLATAETADLEKENEEIARSISRVESRLPSDKEVEVVLEQVADLARKSKLQLQRVATGKPVEATSYMEQPLKMKIHGNFDDFYVFLLELERLERITRMLDLTVEGDRKESGLMDAEFTLSIYFQPANPAPTTQLVGVNP